MDKALKYLPVQLKLKQREAIVKKIQKQVTQYSLTGKKINTYASMAAAEKLTGVHVTSIGMVAGGGGISAGGYLWQFGNNKTIDISSIRQQRTAAHRKKYGQKLTQYDFTGKEIGRHFLK